MLKLCDPGSVRADAGLWGRTPTLLPIPKGSPRLPPRAPVPAPPQNNMERDETDLGPMTKEKRAMYKTDRTPKTAYVPDNLAWDGSGLYVLMIPFLVVVALSLFGGVNLFGYACERASLALRSLALQQVERASAQPGPAQPGPSAS